MVQNLIDSKQDLFYRVKMFPNDDICNVDAARLAAQRLFKKYRNTASSEQASLGKNQVKNLMKATYEAINMPYKPDEEDVFSFISVFDSNQDGRIELKDIEELAVKYLCGEEALAGLKLNTQEQPAKNHLRKKQQEIKVESSSKIEKHKIEGEKSHQQLKYKQLKIQNEDTPSNVQRVYSPKVNYPSSLTSFFSPKSRIPSKESAASTSLESGSFKTQSQSQRTSTVDELAKQGKTIFQKYSNHVLGVTEANASKVMTETYQLFGMKNFKPTAEDIRIWMKLCDKNKDGVVDWQDYRYFIQRTYERNRVSS